MDRKIYHFGRQSFFSRIFDDIFDEIGDFGEIKHHILDKIILVSQNMLVEQYKTSAL